LKTNRNRRHGAIIIVTMLVVFTLASIVLVLCGTMRVESMSSANLSSTLQAASIERGAEQYVIALLTEEKTTLSTLTDNDFAQVPVGDGYFWIIRPNYGDANLPYVGLTEENAKLNINTATYESLMRLPNMTDDVATAIVSWRGGTATGSSSGADDSYYSSLSDPYQPKKGAFETVEELLLVQGMSRQLLYGDGSPDPLGQQSNIGTGAAGGQPGADLVNVHGIYDFLTVNSTEAAGTGQKVNISDRNSRTALQTLLENKLTDKSRAAAIMTQLGRDTYNDVFDFYFGVKMTSDEFGKIYDSITATATNTVTPARPPTGGATAAAAPVKGLININTAPRDVLFCIPGLESSDVDSLISARQGTAAGATNIAWIVDVLDQKKCHGLASKITGKSSQYSADIVAVSGDGRSFKRVRIVVDASSTSPQIVYRRDLSDRSWPMNPQILTLLRSGQGMVSLTGTRMSGGMTR